jgi:ABC-type multidrug transport system ATPase subunit
MNEPAIRVDQLAKSFGSQQVLRDVSFSVPAGQTFALLGRNGAGKTTTIRIMLGLIGADSGTVHLAGIDPTRDPLPFWIREELFAAARPTFCVRK